MEEHLQIILQHGHDLLRNAGADGVGEFDAGQIALFQDAFQLLRIFGRETMRRIEQEDALLHVFHDAVRFVAALGEVLGGLFQFQQVFLEFILGVFPDRFIEYAQGGGQNVGEHQAQAEVETVIRFGRAWNDG